jgi:hypothetical protein
MAGESHREISCHPGNAHGGRASEVHCGRLAKGIITAACVVMTDKTDWSSPIGVAHQAELKTARCLALQGYATAQSRVTSVTHAIWLLWYPLEYKRRVRPRLAREAEERKEKRVEKQT